MRKIVRTITSTPAVASIKNICTGDVQNVEFSIIGDFDIAKAWRLAKRYMLKGERVVDIQVGDTVTARYAMSVEDFIGNAEAITDDEPEAE